PESRRGGGTDGAKRAGATGLRPAIDTASQSEREFAGAQRMLAIGDRAAASAPAPHASSSACPSGLPAAKATRKAPANASPAPNSDRRVTRSLRRRSRLPPETASAPSSPSFTQATENLEPNSCAASSASVSVI